MLLKLHQWQLHHRQSTFQLGFCSHEGCCCCQAVCSSHTGCLLCPVAKAQGWIAAAGMKCGGCVSQVKGLLERQPTVTMATVNLATETALVRVVLPGCDSGADSAPRRLQELGEQLAMVSMWQGALAR